LEQVSTPGEVLRHQVAVPVGAMFDIPADRGRRSANA